MKTDVAAWFSLMAGFILTMLLSRIGLGSWYLPLAIAIALAQTAIVMLWFMRLRSSSRLTWLFALGGIYWLGILFILGLSDYFSRGWLK